jgi:hypothetical protein
MGDRISISQNTRFRPPQDLLALLIDLRHLHILSLNIESV